MREEKKKSKEKQKRERERKRGTEREDYKQIYIACVCVRMCGVCDVCLRVLKKKKARALFSSIFFPLIRHQLRD